MRSPIRLPKERPLLDVASYGRGGLRQFSKSELQLIERTVHRLPEVMVKVTGGAHQVAGVQRHLQYIDREGTLQVETDIGAFRRPVVEGVYEGAEEVVLVTDHRNVTGSGACTRRATPQPPGGSRGRSSGTTPRRTGVGGTWRGASSRS